MAPEPLSHIPLPGQRRGGSGAAFFLGTALLPGTSCAAPARQGIPVLPPNTEAVKRNESKMRARERICRPEFCELEKLRYGATGCSLKRVSVFPVVTQYQSILSSSQSFWRRTVQALLLLRLQNCCWEITLLGSNLIIAQGVCSLRLFSIVSQASAESSELGRCLRPAPQMQLHLFQ